MTKGYRWLKRLVTAAVFVPALAAGSTAAMAEMVLHRGNATEPETLDVQLSTGVPEANIIYDMFEGLLVYGADGAAVPGVAEKWEISDDGMTYTFHLRANAKWSNGDPVTAEDFVYSFRRIATPETAADYAPIYYLIKHFEPIHKGEEKDIAKLGVEAIDAKTLKITLEHPAPYFLEMLAHHASWPVHKATLEKHGKEWTRPGNAVSNGAYMISEWVPQSHVTLVKNPNFHAADTVKIDKVIFYPTEDETEEFKRYRAGELHMSYSVPGNEIPRIRQEMPNEFRNDPQFGTYYYGINMSKEPLGNNLKLRQALSLAVDRDIIVEKITQAGQQPAYGWVPPGLKGYTQQTVFANMTQAERDEMAKTLIKEAGYGPGGKPLSVEILYNTSESHKKIAVAIAAMWKDKLGVDATMVNQEWKVYLENRDQGNFQITRAAWIGDYFDASNFLDLFLSYAGERNDIRYNNAKYDELYKQSQVEKDPAKRAKLLEEMEKIFLDDSAMIPIYHYTAKKLVKPEVEGFVSNPLDYHLTRYMSLKM